MSLSVFIRMNEESIILGWQEFAQTYLPSAEHMDRNALRDHIIGLLRFIADDLEIPQTERERTEKAKGQGLKGGKEASGAAGIHGELRFAAGFDTVEMISEFRALRASVIKLWRVEWTQIDDVLPDLLRFNEAIDQVMTESLSRFISKSKSSGEHLVDILTKEIRGPLQQIQESINKLQNRNKDGIKDDLFVDKILLQTSRMNEVVSSVIDLIQAPLGLKNLVPPIPPK